MARHAGPRLPLIVKSLIPTLSSAFDSQRVTATAFLAEVSRAEQCRIPKSQIHRGWKGPLELPQPNPAPSSHPPPSFLGH